MMEAEESLVVDSGLHHVVSLTELIELISDPPQCLTSRGGFTITYSQKF
jgi:hypothetical protein